MDKSQRSKPLGKFSLPSGERLKQAWRAGQAVAQAQKEGVQVSPPFLKPGETQPGPLYPSGKFPTPQR